MQNFFISHHSLSAPATYFGLHIYLVFGSEITLWRRSGDKKLEDIIEEHGINLDRPSDVSASAKK